jgi:colanic acid/amylovoran biosynthesis glycosyltransferase
MRRVVHVVPTYLPRTETFLHNLMSSHQAYVPTVLAGDIVHRDEFPLDDVVRIGSRGRVPGASAARRWTSRARGFRRQLEFAIYRATRGRGDILHAHYGPIGCDSVEPAARLGIPLVTSFYGYDMALPRSPMWREAYRRLFAHGAAFVCEGPHMAAQLAAIGCPESKIRVVPIGIKVASVPFDVRPRKRAIVALQVARLVEKKGVDLSIRAFAAAGGPDRGWKLWIVGDGPERRKLEGIARELGVDADVTFFGELPQARLRELLAQADVGLQPSRTASDGDTEGGAPTVLLEMQAAGMPVVATRHADIPFVVAASDQLAPECREFVLNQHDAHVVARLMETVYDELLAVGVQPASQPRRPALDGSAA